MFEQNEKEQLVKGMRVLKIIWGAMLLSLGIYVFVCHFIGSQAARPMGENFPVDLLRNILYVISAAELFLIHFLKKIMLKAPAAGQPADTPARKETANVHPAVGKYTAAMIVCYSIAESIGIYGVVLFFLSLDYETLYVFIFISAVAMVFFRPKFEELEQLAAAMKGVTQE